MILKNLLLILNGFMCIYKGYEVFDVKIEKRVEVVIFFFMLFYYNLFLVIFYLFIYIFINLFIYLK